MASSAVSASRNSGDFAGSRIHAPSCHPSRRTNARRSRNPRARHGRRRVGRQDLVASFAERPLGDFRECREIVGMGSRVVRGAVGEDLPERFALQSIECHISSDSSTAPRGSHRSGSRRGASRRAQAQRSRWPFSCEAPRATAAHPAGAPPPARAPRGCRSRSDRRRGFEPPAIRPTRSAPRRAWPAFVGVVRRSVRRARPVPTPSSRESQLRRATQPIRIPTLGHFATWCAAGCVSASSHRDQLRQRRRDQVPDRHRGALRLALDFLVRERLPASPAARLVMSEMQPTCMPRCRARETSGTVDIPTASAPIERNIRTSAGVS